MRPWVVLKFETCLALVTEAAAGLDLGTGSGVWTVLVIVPSVQSLVEQQAEFVSELLVLRQFLMSCRVAV